MPCFFFSTEGKIDGRNRHRINRRGDNQNFVRGLVLSLFVASHQLPRKNASFPCACVFFCVRASCRLLSAWVLIPLPFGTIASYSPFFRSIDTNFPFPTSSAPCVLLHSFSLCFLSWDIFVSHSSLDSPATYTLTRGGAASTHITRFSLRFGCGVGPE